MSTPTYNKFSSIAIGGSNINKVPTTSYGNVSLSVSGKSYHSDASYFDGDISLVGNLNVGSTIISAVELSYIDGLTSNVQTQINNKTTLSDIQSNNNSWTGTNTFNTSLPTSTMTPSASTQLTTKAYVDSAISSGGGSSLLSSSNTWTGTSNIFNNTVQILSGQGLFIGNGQSDSSTQKLRLSVNSSTGKSYMDWTGDNNLYMRIGTTPTTYYTFGTSQLTLIPSILRINNIDISSDGTNGFTFGATSSGNHYFNGSLNVSSYLTTTNNITCPNIIVSTNTQTSSLTTGTITASGISTFNDKCTITASTGTSLVISGTSQTTLPPSSANGTHLRLIATNTADNTYSTITFHANDSTSSNRNCATIAMYKASTWGTSSYPTDMIFYSRPASGNQVERLRLTYDNKAVFSSTIQTSSIDPNSLGYIVIGNNTLTNADCSFYPGATTGQIDFLSGTFSLNVDTTTFNLMAGANMKFWNTLSTKSSQIFSDNNGGMLFQNNNSGSSHTFSTMSGTTSTNQVVISNSGSTINNPLTVNNTISTTSTISSTSSISASSFSVPKGNMFYASSLSGMNYGQVNNFLYF